MYLQGLQGASMRISPKHVELTATGITDDGDDEAVGTAPPAGPTATAQFSSRDPVTAATASLAPSSTATATMAVVDAAMQLSEQLGAERLAHTEALGQVSMIARPCFFCCHPCAVPSTGSSCVSTRLLQVYDVVTKLVQEQEVVHAALAHIQADKDRLETDNEVLQEALQAAAREKASLAQMLRETVSMTRSRSSSRESGARAARRLAADSLSSVGAEAASPTFQVRAPAGAHHAGMGALAAAGHSATNA